MNIASAKVDELAQRLARLTGEDVETAVERAIAERLSRIARPVPPDRQAALRRFFDRVSEVPVKDFRSATKSSVMTPRAAVLMVLDTSAVIAAITNEPDGGRFHAFRRYGKGRGHPAQLNIIDCAAYAVAKVQGEPLLFKGGDFNKTDLQPAL
jgi:antitoxin VapB